MRTANINFCNPWLAICTLAMLLISASPCAAVTGLDKCSIYVMGKTQIPADLKKKMVIEGDSAARACLTPSGGWEKYISLSPVWPGKFDICEFTATPEGKQPIQPTVMRLIARNCPSQNDSRYIATSGVSEGLFVEFIRLWSDIASSPGKFHSAFATVDLQFPLADENTRQFFAQLFDRTKE